MADTHAVLEATANMLIAAIGGHIRAQGSTLEHARALATQLGRDLPDHHVAEQWNRQPLPTDIVVGRG